MVRYEQKKCELIICDLLSLQGYNVVRIAEKKKKINLVAFKDSIQVNIIIRHLEIDRANKNYKSYKIDAFNDDEQRDRAIKVANIVIGYDPKDNNFACVPINEYRNIRTTVFNEKTGKRTEYLNNWNALNDFFTNLIDSILNEENYDVEYQKEITKTISKGIKTEINIEDLPVKKPIINEEKSINKYRRNPQIGKNAIIDANYRCEYNLNHNDFTSSVTKKQYVEAHHLIPMKYQDFFKFSIDVEANVVSLCVTCHKTLHHAIFEEKETIIKELFNKRIYRLKKCGISVSEEVLNSFYK